MKPSNIFSILDLARRARQKGKIFNPLFVGAPGLGKTEIVEQWCKTHNLNYITLTSALLEAPDVRGYPIVQVVDGRQRMTCAAPDFWPNGGEGVIILEEVNRGTTAIMNCWMALTDARRGFDNYTLPPGYIVVGCINPENGECDVNTMDSALKDRFEMFQVNYDRASLLTYANEAAWDKRLINFIESGIYHYKAPEEIGNVVGSKYVSPRTLSKLNTVLEAGFDVEDELEIYKTLLGSLVAKDFYDFLHNESPVMYVELVRNPKDSLAKLKSYANPDNYKNGLIGITVKDILDTATIEDNLLAEVLETIPVEQGTVLIRDLEAKRNDPSILKRMYKINPRIKKIFTAVIEYGK